MLIIEAEHLSDGLYNIKNGKIFKYKANGGTVRTYKIHEAEPCEDAISRAELIERLEKDPVGRIWVKFNNLGGFIKAIPSVAPSRPSGEWIPCTKNGLALTELMRKEGQKWYGYRCTSCSYIYKGNALTECNFCPNCGADMRGEDDE